MEHKPLVGLAMCGSYCTYAQVFAAAAAQLSRQPACSALSGSAAFSSAKQRTRCPSRASSAHRETWRLSPPITATCKGTTSALSYSGDAEAVRLS